MIARLESEAEKLCLSVTNVNKINSTTATYTLTKSSEVNEALKIKTKSLKVYFKGVKMIGKHFLMNSVMDRRVKRQYTICNCLTKEIYD